MRYPNAFGRKALLVIKCVANTLQFLSHGKNEVVSMKSNVESNWFHFLKELLLADMSKSWTSLKVILAST